MDITNFAISTQPTVRFSGNPVLDATTAKEIWQTLSQIDVTPFVEKKVGLTYLP